MTPLMYYDMQQYVYYSVDSLIPYSVLLWGPVYIDVKDMANDAWGCWRWGMISKAVVLAVSNADKIINCVWKTWGREFGLCHAYVLVMAKFFSICNAHPTSHVTIHSDCNNWWCTTCKHYDLWASFMTTTEHRNSRSSVLILINSTRPSLN